MDAPIEESLNVIVEDEVLDVRDVELVEEKPSDITIDELAADDAGRNKLEKISPRTDSAAKYVQQTAPVANVQDIEDSPAIAGLWIPILFGFVLLGSSIALKLRGAESLLGELGPSLIFAGLVIGVFLILMGVYAALRMKSKSR